MQIQPRPFAQVLGEALNGLAATWRPIVSTSLLIFVPVGLLALLTFQWTGGTEFLDAVLNDPDSLETLTDEALTELINSFLTAAAIAAAIQTLGTIFVYLASHKVVGEGIAGNSITGSEARRFALKRYPVAFLTCLIAIVIVAGLGTLGYLVWSIPFGFGSAAGFVNFLFLVACVAPAIWFSIAFSMLLPIVALERRGPIKAITRSFDIVRRRWWPTLGYLVVVGLLGTIAAQLIQLVALPLASLDNLSLGISVASLVGLFAQGLIVAAIGAMWTGWYIDLRARNKSLTTDDLS